MVTQSLYPAAAGNIHPLFLTSRKDFEILALRWLSPLIPKYSGQSASFFTGNTAAVYEEDAARAESFLRPLWALIPLWAGGSGETGFESLYQDGLASGTDPEDPAYWGGFHDFDQRFVEMAALSYGILMVPERLWAPFPDKTKAHIIKWLDGINHYRYPPCNWMFFGILVNLALRSVGAPCDSQRLQGCLDYIESCYQGSGWYIDGQNGEKDYYVSFAFHYYSLIYARFMAKEDPVRCHTYRLRAQQFAADFLLWFSDRGPALAYGRSLTYRMAQAAFFSMCVSCELEVLPYPVMKGIIARHLRFWDRQPIFDSGGILTIGYGYPNLLMSEQYNGPGAPYWSMKVFALLSLPETHPFWKLEEAPFPSVDPVRLISNGNMLIQRLNGEAFAYTPGRTLPHHHVLTEEKYSKFLYSSAFPFSVPRSMRTLEEAAPDQTLAFFLHGFVYTKSTTQAWDMNAERVWMEWVPFPGIQVETEIRLIPGGHRRTHTIRSHFCCEAWDCGPAVPFTARKDSDPSRQGECGLVLSDRTYIRVCALNGDGKAEIIQASPNTNLLYPKTRIPAIRFPIYPGEQTISAEFLYTKVE